MRAFRSVILAAIACAPALWADVTLRYHASIQPSIPNIAIDTPEAIRIKGNQGHITSSGLTMIVDFTTRQVTLIDAWHGKFATVPAAEYSAGLAGTMPEGAVEAVRAMLGSLKSKVESRITGREETIQGVQTAEREVRFSLESPIALQMVMRIWTAKPGEAARVPAVRELAGMDFFQQQLLNPMAGAGGLLPGGADGLGALFAEIQKTSSPVLRMEVALSLPGADGNAPAIQMKLEAVELSTAPVDASIFQIPAEYTAGPFAEVIQGGMTARMPAAAIAAPGASRVPAPGSVQAYVPALVPLRRVEAERESDTHGMVRLLVTVDPRGGVAQAEALTGPEVLRRAAAGAVKQWTFRPVIRNGQAVFAYTDATVRFPDPKAPDMNPTELAGAVAAAQRLSELEQSMPRSPQLVLADLEQDSEGGDPERRFLALGAIAKAALRAGAEEKAAAIAGELLEAAARRERDWNYGNAIHDAHTMLGLLAERHGELAAARRELLAAGKTPGSPQLDSFGPSMALAGRLLDNGERETVLEYFTECRVFWKMGAQKLDTWSEVVRKGGTPDFGANLVF